MGISGLQSLHQLVVAMRVKTYHFLHWCATVGLGGWASENPTLGHTFQLSQVFHSNQGTVKLGASSVTEGNGWTYQVCRQDEEDCQTQSFSKLQVRTREWERNWSKGLDSGQMTQSMLIPDIEDHETIVALATMSSDAYVLPKDDKWIDLDGYRDHETFGFTDDGVRGHVFTNLDNSVQVISFKGTTAELLGVPKGPSGHRDKLNDNLMFSCCCGHVDWTWPTYCDCYKSKGECCQSCLVENVSKADDSYYHDALRIYERVRKEFPEATIWTTGHSLGGSIAALIALQAEGGVASLTFEAPGELLYARRAGIPIPPTLSDAPIFHFGHSADPIFIGECRGFSSSCYYTGYAMESRCHAGHRCLYDVMADPPQEEPQDPAESKKSRWWWPFNGIGHQIFRTFDIYDGDEDLTIPVTSVNAVTAEKEYPDPRTRKWHVLIKNHEIKVVLHQIVEPWPGVPECEAADQTCVDCADWKFV